MVTRGEGAGGGLDFARLFISSTAPQKMRICLSCGCNERISICFECHVHLRFFVTFLQFPFDNLYRYVITTERLLLTIAFALQQQL